MNDTQNNATNGNEETTMTTQHTPGRWTLQGLQVPDFGPDDLLIQINAHGYGPVAWVDGTPHGEEVEANARLIAAAPALLAALLKIRDAPQPIKDVCGTILCRTCLTMREIADAAIAAATPPDGATQGEAR